MHFAKLYTSLLPTLPQDLREHAVQYRQLKKLIHQVESELRSLGLCPERLRSLLDGKDVQHVDNETKELINTEQEETGSPVINLHSFLQNLGDLGILRYCHLTYVLDTAVTGVKHRIRPHLRIDVARASRDSESLADIGNDYHEDLSHNDEQPALSLTGHEPEHTSEDSASQPSHRLVEGASSLQVSKYPRTRHFVIPLEADAAFYESLVATLDSLSPTLEMIKQCFVKEVEDLSLTISSTAKPASSSPILRSYFSPSLVNNGVTSVITGSLRASRDGSDLYTWREILQLYIETEVFEHIGENSRLERSVDGAAERLRMFISRVDEKRLRRKLTFNESRAALSTFLDLNWMILDIKKFQFMTAEAVRKILKKHAKRTALSLPSNSSVQSIVRVPPLAASMPQMMVQGLMETLLPIVPSIDDYACLICMNIAFKPIRLSCGHLFCVRCLVKMQKRGQDHCPLCRAPTVLAANRSNVDHAMLNFMQDWFPREARVKQDANEREAGEEHLIEMGLSPHATCVVT